MIRHNDALWPLRVHLPKRDGNPVMEQSCAFSKTGISLPVMGNGGKKTGLDFGGKTKNQEVNRWR